MPKKYQKLPIFHNVLIQKHQFSSYQQIVLTLNCYGLILALKREYDNLLVVLYNSLGFIVVIYQYFIQAS